MFAAETGGRLHRGCCAARARAWPWLRPMQRCGSCLRTVQVISGASSPASPRCCSLLCPTATLTVAAAESRSWSVVQPPASSSSGRTRSHDPCSAMTAAVATACCCSESSICHCVGQAPNRWTCSKSPSSCSLSMTAWRHCCAAFARLHWPSNAVLLNS